MTREDGQELSPGSSNIKKSEEKKKPVKGLRRFKTRSIWCPGGEEGTQGKACPLCCTARSARPQDVRAIYTDKDGAREHYAKQNKSTKDKQ